MSLDYEEQVTKLTKELVASRKGKKKGAQSGSDDSDEVYRLEMEIEDLRKKNDIDNTLITDLREQIAEQDLKIGSYESDRLDFDKKLRDKAKRIGELEKVDPCLIIYFSYFCSKRANFPLFNMC